MFANCHRNERATICVPLPRPKEYFLVRGILGQDYINQKIAGCLYQILSSLMSLPTEIEIINENYLGLMVLLSKQSPVLRIRTP